MSTKRGVVLGGFLAIAVTTMLIAACVGDSGMTVADSGAPQDATTEHDGGNTAGDAAVDASKSCDVASAFATPVLVSSLDATGANAQLRLTADQLLGFFEAFSDAGLGSIYSTTRATGLSPFGSRTPLVNVVGEFYDPTVSGDGLELIVLSNQAGSDGAFDLWLSNRASRAVDFPPPQHLANVNSVNQEVRGYLREDGEVLYFASDRTPSQGSYDLWRSARSGGMFQTPTHIDELASALDDNYPVVTRDDLAIYFSRDLTTIMVATRSSERPVLRSSSCHRAQ